MAESGSMIALLGNTRNPAISELNTSGWSFQDLKAAGSIPTACVKSLRSSDAMSIIHSVCRASWVVVHRRNDVMKGTSRLTL